MNKPKIIKEKDFLENFAAILSEIKNTSSEIILEKDSGEKFVIMSLSHYQEEYDSIVETVSLTDFSANSK